MAGTNARNVPVFRSSAGWASDQGTLLLSSVDLLEADHLVRKLLKLVDDLFGQELRVDCNLTGGFRYDPVSLLAIWMYGYLQGELSSRKLEEHCRYDVRFEFLARSCKPDHTTLSRFRTALGSKIDDLMVRFCFAAAELGVLQRKTMVIDGTKMTALRSQWSRARKKADEIEDLEAEAVTMVSHGQYLVGYNVQAAADADSTLIVGYVVTSQPSDSKLLEEVCQAVKHQSGELSKQAVCDKGYNSSANALALAQAQVEGYLPPPRKKPPPFALNDSQEMACMAGHIASKHEWVDSKNGNKRYDLFRVSACAQCPFNSECPGKGRQREMKVLAVDPSDEKHKANQRCLTDDGKKLMKIRGQTIERAFAVIKGCFKLRKFKLRGRKKVAIEFGLAVLTYNLQVFMRLVA
jgi:transposase